MEDIFDNSIGDWFISSEQKKINASMLADAELQRKQTEELIAYMQQKKVGATNVAPDTNKQKYIIVGGLAVIMLFVIVLSA